MKTGTRPHPPNPDFSHYRLGLTSSPSQGYLEGHAKAGSMSEPRGPARAWRGGRSYSRRPITWRRERQGSSAFALSIAHRIEATVLEGVNLSPQSRTARESHCHQDPHFQVAGDAPTLWQMVLREGPRDTSVSPERTVTREGNGVSTFSSHQNNNNNNNNNNKGKFFHSQKNILPRERTRPSSPGWSREEGLRSQTSTFSGVREQTESKAPTASRAGAAGGRAQPGLPRLARSRSSGKA